MSEEIQEEKKGRVISITTRRDIPAEELESLTEEFGEPDETETESDLATVELVENFANMVYEGRYCGALIVGWNSRDKCFFSDLVLPNDDHADLSAMKLIGQLENLKSMLLEIVNAETLVEYE